MSIPPIISEIYIRPIFWSCGNDTRDLYVWTEVVKLKSASFAGVGVFEPAVTFFEGQSKEPKLFVYTYFLGWIFTIVYLFLVEKNNYEIMIGSFS